MEIPNAWKVQQAVHRYAKASLWRVSTTDVSQEVQGMSSSNVFETLGRMQCAVMEYKGSRGGNKGARDPSVFAISPEALGECVLSHCPYFAQCLIRFPEMGMQFNFPLE